MIIGANNLSNKLGVSRETIYKYCKDGMPYIQISERKRAFKMEDIEKWLKKKGDMSE